jgi:hypothetical protein
MSNEEIEENQKGITEENEVNKINEIINNNNNEFIKDEYTNEEELYENKRLLEKEDDNKNIITMLPYATSFLNQFYYLSLRAFFNFIRNFYLFPAHFLSAIFVGLLLGTVNYKFDIRFIGN